MKSKNKKNKTKKSTNQFNSIFHSFLKFCLTKLINLGLFSNGNTIALSSILFKFYFSLEQAGLSSIFHSDSIILSAELY